MAGLQPGENGGGEEEGRPLEGHHRGPGDRMVTGTGVVVGIRESSKLGKHFCRYANSTYPQMGNWVNER